LNSIVKSNTDVEKSRVVDSDVSSRLYEHQVIDISTLACMLNDRILDFESRVNWLNSLEIEVLKSRPSEIKHRVFVLVNERKPCFRPSKIIKMRILNCHYWLKMLEQVSSNFRIDELWVNDVDFRIISRDESFLRVDCAVFYV